MRKHNVKLWIFLLRLKIKSQTQCLDYPKIGIGTNGLEAKFIRKYFWQ